jgi:hypothetical protein
MHEASNRPPDIDAVTAYSRNEERSNMESLKGISMLQKIDCGLWVKPNRVGEK